MKQESQHRLVKATTMFDKGLNDSEQMLVFMKTIVAPKKNMRINNVQFVNFICAIE
jgi:hypothetical protein